MFSLTVEYALRAAVYMADVRGRRITSQEIAEECGVPASYMSKVLQSLTESGLVTSQRGPSGGFALSKEPESLTMFDIVDAISPIRRVEKCPYDHPEHSQQLCPLHRELNELTDMTTTKLRSRTLDSLAGGTATPAPVSNGSTARAGNIPLGQAPRVSE